MTTTTRMRTRRPRTPYVLPSLLIVIAMTAARVRLPPHRGHRGRRLIPFAAIVVGCDALGVGGGPPAAPVPSHLQPPAVAVAVADAGAQRPLPLPPSVRGDGAFFAASSDRRSMLLKPPSGPEGGEEFGRHQWMRRGERSLEGTDDIGGDGRREEKWGERGAGDEEEEDPWWMPLLLSTIAGMSTCLGAAVAFCLPGRGKGAAMLSDAAGRAALSGGSTDVTAVVAAEDAAAAAVVVSPGVLCFSLSLAGSVMITVSCVSLLPQCFGNADDWTVPTLSVRCFSFALGCGLYKVLSWSFPEPDEILWGEGGDGDGGVGLITEEGGVGGKRNVTEEPPGGGSTRGGSTRGGGDTHQVVELRTGGGGGGGGGGNHGSIFRRSNSSGVSASGGGGDAAIARPNTIRSRIRSSSSRDSADGDVGGSGSNSNSNHGVDGDDERRKLLAPGDFSLGDAVAASSSQAIRPPPSVLRRSASSSASRGGGGGGGAGAAALSASPSWSSVASSVRGSDLGTAEQRRSWRVAMLLFFALLAHNFPEGLAVAASAASSHHLGLTVTVGIMIHNIPEGIAIAVPCLKARPNDRWLAFALASVSGLAEPLGAAVTVAFIRYGGVVAAGSDAAAAVSRDGRWFVPPTLEDVLAFVAGVMITVAVCELFPEARRHMDGGGGGTTDGGRTAAAASAHGGGEKAVVAGGETAEATSSPFAFYSGLITGFVVMVLTEWYLD